MRYGKFNTVVDGQHGSTGKGLISSYLAHKYRPEMLSTTNMANAGHTVVNTDGRKFIAKALPSPAILNAWHQKPSQDGQPAGRRRDSNYDPIVIIGPSAAFHLDQFLKEINECEQAYGLQGERFTKPLQLWLHPRAGVITQAHRDAEADLETGTKHIASTMQGCGSFLADKIMRRKTLKLAGQYTELLKYLVPKYDEYPAVSLPLTIMDELDRGFTVLHEGSQGFSLDIHHGSHYPQCTSRQTTAMQCVADMGISPRYIGDIYLVIRPYPIRVGNVVENGQTLGHSGGHYPDNDEINWETVGRQSGMPESEIQALLTKELTTVTKRLRRVFTFSKQQLREATKINGATRIALNFANYIDWSVSGANTYDKLTKPVLEFIEMVENVAQIPVTLVGTGPQIDHVVDLS